MAGLDLQPVEDDELDLQPVKAADEHALDLRPVSDSTPIRGERNLITTDLGPAPVREPSAAQQEINKTTPARTNYKLTPKVKGTPQTSEEQYKQTYGEHELTPVGERPPQVAPGSSAPSFSEVERQDPFARTRPVPLNPDDPRYHEMPGSFEGHPENTSGYVEEGPIKAAKAAGTLAADLRPSAATPEERYRAGSDILQGAMTTATPLLPFSAAAAPVSSGIGLGAGALASTAAEKLTAAAGGSPEAQNFAATAGWFIPNSLAMVSGLRGGIERVPGKGTAGTASAFGDRVAAGFKNTPENFQAGVKVGGTRVGVDIPKAPPMNAAQAEAVKTLADATSAMARRDAADSIAQRMTGSPLAPPPPPPEAQAPPQAPQTPISNGHVSQELLDGISQVIQKLPPEVRPQAQLEAHQKMTEALTQQGKVVGPDGQLHVVENEKQASKLAQQWMNDQVSRVDEAAKNAPAPKPQAAAGPAAPSQPEKLIGSAKEPVVQESRATVDAQVAALKKGEVPVVFIPAGSSYQPGRPAGFQMVKVDDKHPGGGVYFYDPAQISGADIRKAARDGDHGQLLGHLQSKEELKSAPATVVVQASNKAGVPIQDSEVDASRPDVVREQAALLQQRHPEAQVSVKPTNQVLSERQEAVKAEESKVTTEGAKPPAERQPQTFTKGQQVRFLDHEGAERTGTIRHINSMAARIQGDDGSKHEIAPSKIQGKVEKQIVPGNTDTDVTDLKKKYGIGVDTEKAAKEFHELTKDDAELEKRYDALGKPNYVAADHVKELSPAWQKSVHDRAELDKPIHAMASNAAFRLFNRKLARIHPGSSVQLITGPVAAGKSKFSAESPADLTYEVNLSNFEKASEHVDNILKHGGKPSILYVYNTPEGSAMRRAARMMRDGRPVSISDSTPQHLELPQTIEKLHQKYGDKLRIRIVDNSQHGGNGSEVPIEEAQHLRYTGTKDDLLDRQQAELDRLHKSSAITQRVLQALSRRADGSDRKEWHGELAAGGERSPERGRDDRVESPSQGAGQGVSEQRPELRADAERLAQGKEPSREVKPAEQQKIPFDDEPILFRPLYAANGRTFEVHDGGQTFDRTFHKETSRNFAKASIQRLPEDYDPNTPKSWLEAGADGKPPVVYLNPAAQKLLGEIIGFSGLDKQGVALPRKLVAKAEEGLDERQAKASGDSARSLEQLREHLHQAWTERPLGGVATVRRDVIQNRSEEAKAAQEERLHVVQREIGKGEIAKHAPVDKLYELPETQKALPYLEKLGYDTKDKAVVVAELAAKLSGGDRPSIGLDEDEAMEWMDHYVTGIKTLNGIDSVLKLEAVADRLMAAVIEVVHEDHRREEEANTTKPASADHRVLQFPEQGRTQGSDVENAARNRGGEKSAGQPAAKRTHEVVPLEWEHVPPASAEHGHTWVDEYNEYSILQNRYGHYILDRIPQDDDGFPTEDFEQMGVYGSLAEAQNAAAEFNADENESPLFRREKREQGKAAEITKNAAAPIKNFIGSEIEKNQQARELHADIYDLESQYTADVLRAVQLLKQVPGSAADEEKIYHHLENPTVQLTEGQKNILEKYVRPLMTKSDAIYKKLSDGGVPIENYVHRVVQERGSLMDRVMSGLKGNGRGSILSTSAPALKGRTMMALQDGNGKRIVVAVKGGKVVQMKGETGTDLGSLSSGMTTRGKLIDERLAPIEKEIEKLKDEQRILSATVTRREGSMVRLKNISARLKELEASKQQVIDSVNEQQLKGSVFVDNNRKPWTFTQATTKEIEAATKLRYYHNAIGSAITSYLKLRKAERAFDFLESFKSAPEFSRIAVNAEKIGNPPKGWRLSQLPQFRNYYFEPHTAEVLDWYAKKLQSEGPSVMEKISQIMRTSIFFNPLIHTPNIAVHWIEEKGMRGWLPDQWPRTVRAGMKAINAVAHQNDDYLAALDAGAPLQYQKFQTAKFTELFFKKMADELKGSPELLHQVGTALGYANPVHLLKAIYDFSGKVTWVTNDLAFLQAAYEKTEDGMTLKDALRETAKHIPDYRLPTRIFNNRNLASLMGSPWVTMFGAYHYGALKSYGEMVKSLVGQSKIPQDEEGESFRSKTEESLHAADLLAFLGLITFIVYPAIDKMLKKATGNKDASLRRAGAATLPYNLAQLAKGEKSPPEVVESVATPAAGTFGLGQIIFNRDLRMGQQVYDPHASTATIVKQVLHRLGGTIAPVGEAQHIAEDPHYLAKFLYGLVGVRFPKTGAEKIAADIALTRLPTEAQTPEEREHLTLRKGLLDKAREGDYGPLDDAWANGDITLKEHKQITRDSLQDPLAVQVKSFPLDDFLKVYEAATPEQREVLDPELTKKIAHLHKEDPDAAEKAEEEAAAVQ